MSFLEQYTVFFTSPWQLKNHVFWAILAIHLIVFCISAYFFRVYLIIYQRLINIPTSKIRSTAQGYVELKGLGVLEQPLRSPLSKQACIWWRYKVEKLNGTGKNKRWVTIENGESQNNFILEDGTGKCFVSPQKARVYPLTTRQWRGNSPRPSNKVNRFLLSQTDASYRYQESVILDGFPLYIIGAFHTINIVDSLPNVGDLIRQWKGDYRALLKKYDANNDGEIDLNEWSTVLRDAENEIAKKYASKLASEKINLISHEGLSFDKPYIISAKGEDWLVKQSRRKFIIALLVMLPLLIMNIWAILLR